MITNIQDKNSILENGNVSKWVNREDQNVSLLTDVKKGNETFGDFLANSIQKVNQMQVDADQSIKELASGKSTNIHETLLKVEQADIALKTLVQIKTKLIDAYREIMKMQI